MTKIWNGKTNKVGDRRGCTVTHGKSDTRLYECWTDMKKRCYNAKNKRFDRYGGRGIIVCDEWKNDYVAFEKWALENGYGVSLTLDRIDVNGNYEPTNCRWVTMAEQQRNTSRNHFITANGETKTISEWARQLGVSPDLIKDRISKLHWSESEAVSIPKMKVGEKRCLKQERIQNA